MAQKISKTKADAIVADLKDKLGNHLANFTVVGGIIREWLDEHIGIADINLDYSETGTALDTSEGVI